MTVAGSPTSTMTDDQRTALEAQPDRLRLPVPSSPAGILGAGEPGPAADDRGPAARARRRVARRELLGYLGLAKRETHRPAELSGGEQQRVAIARAVANGPRILLADEPTGNLDPKTAEHVFATLASLVKATGLAALIATHNMDLAARMDRRVTIRDGQVVELG